MYPLKLQMYYYKIRFCIALQYYNEFGNYWFVSDNKTQRNNRLKILNIELNFQQVKISIYNIDCTIDLWILFPVFVGKPYPRVQPIPITISTPHMQNMDSDGGRYGLMLIGR